jgi:hypothetical protein
LRIHIFVDVSVIVQLFFIGECVIMHAIIDLKSLRHLNYRGLSAKRYALYYCLCYGVAIESFCGFSDWITVGQSSFVCVDYVLMA